MKILSFPPVILDSEKQDFSEHKVSIVLKDTDQEKWSLNVECNNAGHIHILAHPKSHASKKGKGKGELYFVRLCLDKTNSISFGDFMNFLVLFGSISEEIDESIKEIDVSRRPFKYVLDYGYGKSIFVELDDKKQLISNQSNSCKIVEFITIRTLMNRYHWILKSVNNVLETEKSNRLPKMRNSSSCWTEISILPPTSGREIEYVVLNNIVLLPGKTILCKTDDIVINQVSSSSEEIRLAIRSVPARKFLEPKHEQDCFGRRQDSDGHFTIPNFKHIGNKVSRSPLSSDDGWKLSSITTDQKEFSENWTIVPIGIIGMTPDGGSARKYLPFKRYGPEMVVPENEEKEKGDKLYQIREETAGAKSIVKDEQEKEVVADEPEKEEDEDLNFTKISPETAENTKESSIPPQETHCPSEIIEEAETARPTKSFQQLIQEGGEKILLKRKGALPADTGVLLYPKMGGMCLKSTAMHQVENRPATPPQVHPAIFSPTSFGVKTKYKAYDRNTIDMGFVPQKPNPKLEKYSKSPAELRAMGLRYRKPKTTF